MLSYIQSSSEALTAIKKRLGATDSNVLALFEEQMGKNKKQKSDKLLLVEELNHTVGDVLLLVKRFTQGSFNEVRQQADVLKSSQRTVGVFLLTGEEGKVSLGLSVSPDLTQKISAKSLIKGIGKILSGKENGGGRDDFAQCGGDNPNAIPAIVETLTNSLKKI